MSAEFQKLPLLTSAVDPLRSGEDNEDDAELSALYQTRIEPIIKRLIGSKLHVSLRADDESRNNQDGLELLSETKVLLLQKLRRSANGSEPIHDLESYVRVVTANVFNQHLRRKYPQRLSLQNQFRYLFTHHKDLSLWKSSDGRWVCGVADSQQEFGVPVTINFSDEERGELHLRIASARHENSGRDLIEFALGVFDFHRAPAFLEDVVSFACDVLNIVEPVEVADSESMSELTVPSATPSVLSVIEDEELVRWLWNEILEFPLRHRIALLLNFKDEGENLISIFSATRVASIRKIAEALQFHADEFANTLRLLPWDDGKIAEYLGLTRQQVINLRQSARQTLKRKLGERK